MKFNIEITLEDAERILHDGEPSEDLKATAHSLIFRNMLNGLTDSELREEIEAMIDRDVLVDLFFDHVFQGKGWDRSAMIDILTDLAYQTYGSEVIV